MKQNNFIYIGVILLLQLVIIQACVFNSACSGNGICVNHECNCYTGWTGDDCTIQLIDVTSGESVTETLDDRQWIYFDIPTTDTDLSITFTVNQSSIISDCDLYIQKDGFPSKSTYYKKDSSRDLNFAISIDSPGAHVWYAGVFGFYSCAFDMTFTVATHPTCPNQCSNQGVCQTNNTCACNEGYAGNDCSITINKLTNNVGVANHISQYAWEYFYYDSVPVGGLLPEFTIIINQTTSGEGDSDMYVKLGTLPTLFVYDYRDATLQDNYALTIGNPSEGTYYIGIYGYRACSYSIKLTVKEIANCDDKCSSHGNCVDNSCHCTGPFNGTKCETMTSPLQDGNSVAGYVENNQWNYYYIDTQTSNNIVVNINQQGNGDCDVYIKSNENPTKTSFDLRDIGFSSSFNLTIINPFGSVWHIGVYGYRSCNYLITEYISKNSCPNNCNGNGVCSNGGRCACNSGFAGNDCGSPLYRIHSGELLSGTVSQNNWVYYKYTAPSTKSSITVEVLETGSTGYLWLYLEHGVPPTQSQNLASATEQSASHTIHILIDEENSDSDFYIGVYGNPFLPLTTDQSYQIVVYSPSL